jgi:multicomponent K+:H+ antiporter subunit A
LAVATPFAGALLIGLLRAAGWTRAPFAALGVLASAVTAALVALLWLRIPYPFETRVEWAGAAQLGFGLAVDELALVFAVLVTGIGLLTFAYSALFIERSRAAYNAYLLLFTGSMLGVVFATDLVQLYLFWELTDLASFLLIGLNWRDTAARAAALRVLLITTLGGLGLLLGIVLLGALAGTYQISQLNGGLPLADYPPLLTLTVALIVLGAVTKAAQFPLHVWLPPAMRAPTPVNAYLDSAALLAAGVYLLARLQPALADVPLWTWAVGGAGLASMLAGGLLALAAGDFKVILAYSTVSQYGFIFLLLGLASPQALAGALFLLLQHGLLKAALFFVVGLVAIATGVTAAGRSGGLWRRMPVTFAIAAVLAFSLGGLPPLAGFWMKEVVFGSVAEAGGWVLPGLVVLGSGLTLAYMLRFLRLVFVAGEAAPELPRAEPRLLLAVPGMLALLTIGFGLEPGLPAKALAAPAAGAATGVLPRLELSLYWGPALLLSLLALGLGSLGFLSLERWQPLLLRMLSPAWTLDRIYSAAGEACAAAGRLTLRLQNGLLLRYLAMVMMALLGMLALSGAGDVVRHGVPLTRVEQLLPLPGWDWRMLLLLLLICAGSLLTLLLRQHVQMVLALGAVGYLIGGVFALALAPSLGILQVHVETLVTVLLILPLAAIPRELLERFYTGARERVTGGRLLLAATAGLGGGWVSWWVLEHLPAAPIAPWFNDNAAALTGATDVVAAVLLHFRALDTLAEVLVFATATAGVFALARLIRKERG